MKIGLDDVHLVLNHVMLQSRETVLKIKESEAWKERKEITAEVKINGILVPAEAFDDYLKNVYNRMVEQIRREQDVEKFDKRVQKAAEKLLQNEADKVMECMDELQQTLKSAGDIIKPFWEREAEKKADSRS